MIQLNIQNGAFFFPGEFEVRVRCLHVKELHWRAQLIATQRLPNYRGGHDPEDWSWRGQQPVEDGQEIVLDLQPATRGESGYLALQLGDGKEWSQRLWLDMTGVALTQFRTPGRLTAWAVDLNQGFPISELHSLRSTDGGGRSLAKNIALEVPHQDRLLALTVAEPPPSVPTIGLWHVCSDRGLYQAGETAALGGWLRTRRAPSGPLAQTGCGFLEYTSQALGQGRCQLSRRGGFLLQIPIPAGCPSGWQPLTLSGRRSDGERFEQQLAVRVGTPGYSDLSNLELDIQPGPGPAQYTACARLLTGQPVLDRIDWEVEFRAVQPLPSIDHGFSFGARQPHQALSSTRLSGQTDHTGRHTVTLQGVPSTAALGRLTAVLGFPLGQRWSAQHEIRVSGCSLLVGLRRQGDEVEVIVCDHEGTLQPGHEVGISPGFHKILSQEGPVRVPVSGLDGSLSASVRDQQGLESVTVLDLQVTPPPAPASSRMWTEKHSYRPGETVRLWVQLPEPGGVGLLHALQYESRVLLQQGISEALTLWEFNVDAAMLGGVGLRLDIISSRGHQSLQAELFVPYQQQRLQIDLEPLAESFRPGQEAEVRVGVRDAQGRAAAGAEVLLLVLDADAERAGGSGMRDPLLHFYQRQPTCLTVHSTADQRLASQVPPPPRPPEPHPGPRICYDEPRFADPTPSRPFLRRSPQPLACWLRLECDERGQAVARFPLAHQAAVYQVRAMAAWNDDCFGHDSTQVSACSSTLTMRALPPEFARPGDELTVKISLEKTGLGPLPVQVYARVLGGELLESGGWSILLKDPLHLNVRIRVGQPGVLVLQLAAQSSAGLANLEATIPVRSSHRLKSSICRGTLGAPVRLRQSATGPMQLSFTNVNPVAQLGDFVEQVEAPLGWAQAILLILKFSHLVPDLLTAGGRQISQGVSVLDPRRLPELVKKLVAQQLPNGAFPSWAQSHHPGPLGVQQLVRLALQGTDQKVALQRLDAYLAEQPHPSPPHDHRIFEQAQVWFQESSRPESLNAFDCWLSPRGSGRLRKYQEFSEFTRPRLGAAARLRIAKEAKANGQSRGCVEQAGSQVRIVAFGVFCSNPYPYRHLEKGRRTGGGTRSCACGQSFEARLLPIEEALRRRHCNAA